MNDDSDIAALAGLLEDDCARTILVAAKEEPMSVSDLAAAAGVSEPTVYRRLEPLRERGFVEERTRLNADGHHHAVYTATVDRMAFEIAADGVTVDVSRRTSMADRFTDLVREM